MRGRSKVSETINIGPHPNLVNKALRRAEVPGLRCEEREDGGLRLVAEDGLSESEIISRLIDGILALDIRLEIARSVPAAQC
jgi:hypothetical protein